MSSEISQWEDSAFHDMPEHEYSNTLSSPENYRGGAARRHRIGQRGGGSSSDPDNSCQSSSSPCPDYEEIVHENAVIMKGGNVGDRSRALSGAGLVYNLASEGIFRGKDLSPESDPVTKEKIMRSLVYCIHKDEGCKWNGQLGKLKAHLNTCQKDAVACLNQCGAKIARLMMEDHMLYTCKKRLVPCPYCKRDLTGAVIDDHVSTCGFEPIDCENKCGMKVQRNRLKAHQVNTCSKRMVMCSYCAKSFTADTLQSHHKSKCAMFPVPCPNRCDIGSVARDDVERHLTEECANREDVLVTCPFKDAGCEFVSKSGTRGLDDHVGESTKLHLDLMCSLARRQQAHIARLSNQLERAHTSYNGILLWKIKDFSAKLEEARSSEGLELVSMPFYTSAQCGYKLQASVFLNGNGAGEGDHISVYIKILPGEFDTILRWPFRHTVSFSLLDQNEDRSKACNIVESFIPDPSWPNFQRPSKEPDQLGFGFPKFVPHDMLTIMGRQYVKEDAIFIKVRVDPSRNVAV